MSKSPSTYILKYDAGRDCLNVEEGVIGDKKDKVKRRASEPEEGAGIA
jgi:hypothetical protein